MENGYVGQFVTSEFDDGTIVEMAVIKVSKKEYIVTGIHCDLTVRVFTEDRTKALDTFLEEYEEQFTLQIVE